MHSALLIRANDFQLFGQQGYLNPLQSRWIDTLFSSWHGLLSWSPAVYVAVVGTVALLWRRRTWAALALGLLVAMAWVNGSTTDWAGGWSFGGRRFTSMLVMLAAGLALAIDAALRRPHLVTALVVATAIAWNYGLMVQYTAGMVPKDEPVSFGRVVRQQADLLTRSPYVYPFAFPANAWFAWRQGLPVDRYDLLATEAFTTDVTIAMDGRSERYLLDGWEAPGGDEWGAHWWLNANPAVLTVPLGVPTGDATEIEITARTRFEEPTVEARLEVRVNGRPVGQLVAPATAAATTRLTVPGATRLVASRLQPGGDRQRRRQPRRSRPTSARPARSPAGSATGPGRWRSTVCGYDPRDDLVAAAHVAARAPARAGRRLRLQALSAVPHLHAQAAGGGAGRRDRPGAGRRRRSASGPTRDGDEAGVVARPLPWDSPFFGVPMGRIDYVLASAGATVEHIERPSSAAAATRPATPACGI